jgi:AraC family transcriptional regulator, transcriptional activator of pobA
MSSAVNHPEIPAVQVIHLRHSGRGTIAKLPEKGESNISIIYALSGTIVVRSNTNTLLCHLHAVCLIDERDITEIDLIDDAEGYAIFVEKSLLFKICANEDLLQNERNNGVINQARMIEVNEIFQAEVRDLFHKLVRISAITFSHICIQQHVLRILLLYIFFGKRVQEDGFANCRDQELANRFMKLVDQATVKKTIEQYAMELQISRNYLSRTFKKCSGQSPVRYLQQRFVQAAQQLAWQTPLSMKEVGYRLGFDDPAHFSKFFKMNTGLNFTEYKKQILAGAGIHKQEL